MRKPRALIGCEKFGAVRDAFIRAGWDAVSCDLEPTETPGPHIQGDVLEELGGGWDLGIFFPTCTYLCSSGLHWNKRPEGIAQDRAGKTEAALDFVRRLLAAPIPRIAIENPIGCIGTRIRKADQIVQPHQFGHDASKATCLWLKGLPCLTPTQNVTPRLVDGKKRWGNQTDSGQNKLGPSADRAAIRGKTYLGLAEAMADQWGEIARKSPET